MSVEPSRKAKRIGCNRIGGGGRMRRKRRRKGEEQDREKERRGANDEEKNHPGLSSTSQVCVY